MKYMRNQCIFGHKWSKYKLENTKLNLSTSSYNVQSRECEKCGLMELKEFSTKY